MKSQEAKPVRQWQFDREKLKTVILYTCAKCDPTKLGAVKLHKALYYADMLFYAYAGAPITGATYRKRALGPTCDQLLSTLAELARERSIEIRDVDYFGYKKKEYLPLKGAEINRLSAVEVGLLDDVIDFVCFNNSAKTISEFSHNRAWDMAEFGDILPYHSVLHLFPTQVSQEAFDWAASEVAEIEDQRKPSQRLEVTDFADFRARVLQTRSA